VIVATSPVVLFQALWPMSDVPAAAFWTAALAASLAGSRKSALVGGLCAAMGLLIRPNIPLVAVVPAIAAAASATGRERWIRILLVLVPAVPVSMFIAALNAAWFGSPFTSGYGAASDLYAWRNVWPNVKLYASWFLESQSPWALVGCIAGIVPLLTGTRKGYDRRTIGIAVMMLATTLACYVAYSSFEVWWYLRFLLPAAGAAGTLIAVGIIALARTMPPPWGRMAAGVTLWMLIATTLSFAWDANVFGGLKAGERRYIDIGEFVAATLPANAAILSVQHSGSLRFYGGRMTLRFDAVDADWAARAPVEIERAGLHPYLVLDDFELPQFRSQFGLPMDSRLPFPVIARMRELGGLTVFDMGSSPPAMGPVALEPGSAHWCSGPGLPLRVR
jgi:hypothetical protein